MLSRSYQSRLKIGTCESASYVSSDTFIFTDRRFWVNVSQGKVKLVRVNGELELTEFELADGK